MADALFLNATPFRLSINLNSETENRPLGLVSVASNQLTLPASPAPIKAFPDRGVFGGSNEDNYLTIFSEGSARPQVWTIRSSVAITLDLYFYLMPTQVVGVAQTGSTEGIVVEQTTAALAAQICKSLPLPIF